MTGIPTAVVPYDPFRAVDAATTVLLSDLSAINVKSTPYNARGDGVTDDSAALVAAAAAAVSGGKALYVPAGTYIVTASAGTPVVTLTKAIRIFGDGMHRSVIKLAGGTAATVDVFKYAPAVSSTGDGDGAFWSDFQIDGNSAGRHGIMFDASASGAFLRKFNIDRVWVQALGGDCIRLDATTSGGGLGIFTAEIQNCFLSVAGGGTNACIRGINLFDSLSVRNNSLTGSGYGFYANFYAAGGAGSFNFTENNMTALGGFHVDEGIYKASIERNYFEFNVASGAFIGSNSAYVDINGVVGLVFEAPTITRNLFSIIGVAGIDNLRLNFADKANVSDNAFISIAGRSAVVLTANCTSATVDRRNTFQGAGSSITSAAAGYSIGEPWIGTVLADSTAIANTGVATVFNKKITIPAGFLQVGDSIELTAYGIYSTTATPTVRLDFLLQGAQFGASTITGAAGAVNVGWTYRAKAIVRTVSNVGVVRAAPDYMGLGGAGFGVLGGQTLNTRDMTATIDVQLQMTWGAADPANTITMQAMEVTIKKAAATF